MSFTGRSCAPCDVAPYPAGGPRAWARLPDDWSGAPGHSFEPEEEWVADDEPELEPGDYWHEPAEEWDAVGVTEAGEFASHPWGFAAPNRRACA